MPHPTKEKGDTGLGFVIAKFMSSGIHVALPLSEHLPFDCIAISGSRMSRVSVKYRCAKDGVIEFSKRSSWANKSGSHVIHHQEGDYDAFAVYCPDTGQCYFFRASEAGTYIFIRLKEDGKRRSDNTFMADSLLDPFRVF